MKTCTLCGQERPLDAFYRNKGSRGGRRAHCKVCHSERAAARRKANLAQHRGRDRVTALRRSYGLTEDTYSEMLAAQDGGCAICGRPPSTRRLAVDHDHLTGEVRGLLCSRCNTALGLFEDASDRLDAAAHYLRRVSPRGALSDCATIRVSP